MQYIIIILIILVIGYIYYDIWLKCNDIKEGFIEKIRNDELYAKFYNTIFNDPAYIEYDYKNIKKIINNNPVTKKKTILDAGTGVGFHYKYLYKDYSSIIGVDNSEYMLKYARIRNQEGSFKLGDLSVSDLFKPNTFTHILCSTDTIHHNDIEKIQDIISNFYMWVKPNGIVMIHIFLYKIMLKIQLNKLLLIQNKYNLLLKV